MLDRPSQNDSKPATEQDKNYFAPPQAVSLPKGGGAIKGMGEKFAANPVTGTGSMSVPIATSPGRSGFSPRLSLSYDSGAGNGIFGFGWSLSLSSITRKTDKGLPRYWDGSESDIFILSGAEDLVQVLVQNNQGGWELEKLPPRKVDDETYIIQRYRPQIEGLFARIERWTNQVDPKDTFWRSLTKDNITTWYGKDSNSRIFDPADPTRIFSWLICESYDDKGNVIVYRYQAEDSTQVDLSQAHERNRIRSANRYLKSIRYGNHEPYRPELVAGQPWPIPPGDDKWFFEVVFDYGEHDLNNPKPGDGGEWQCRLDPFSSYRAGFEVRTYRLCQRVLMFHHFPGEKESDGIEVGENCLVRSLDLTYSYEQNPTDVRNPIYSLLLSVTQTGYKRNQSGGYIQKSLPPLEFTYSKAKIDETVRDVERASLENLPQGLDGTRYQWVDLDGEGLSGILTEQGNGWFYKRNLSPVNTVQIDGSKHIEARFAPVELVVSKPAIALSNGAQFLDLAGDGQLDLVSLRSPTPGFYERTHNEGWESFIPFKSLPNLDWDNPNLKFIDLNGDGHSDILITEDDCFVWYPSLAEEGFSAAERAYQSWDEEKGPRIVFADGTQSIYLADMSGDGLTDIVRIRNGEVCYWPNLGYGRFGAKVTMDNAPWFDAPDIFNQRRIVLADIDGTGTTDILYLSGEGVKVYFNQSGNSWAAKRVLRSFPVIDNVVSVTTLDLRGNGTACLVWSSPLLGNTTRVMRYIDLMGGQKPHLLIRTVNNLGAETVVQYAPSTKFYLQDKLAGKPWITKLPFPVHVVERVETYDRISRNRFVTRYAYHHGYFDGVEREFRGFGMVEQWDTEEFAALSASGAFPIGDNIDAASHVPPVLTKTWFHTGIYLGRERVSNFFAGLLDANDWGEYYREPGLTDEQARQLLLEDTVLPTGLTIEEEREACRALKGSMLRQEVYALDGTDKAEHPYTVAEQNFTIRVLQQQGDNRHAVFFTHAREAIHYHYERNPADPRISHSLTLEVDDFGNVLKSTAIGYGRRQSDPGLNAEDRAKQGNLLITYTENQFTNYINTVTDYRTPLPCESRTYEVTSLDLPVRQHRFNFAEVLSAGIAAVPIAYEEKSTTGTLQKRLIEQDRTLYRRNNLTDSLPLGELQSLALPFESYRLAFTPGMLIELYGERVNEAMLEEGGYIQDEIGWWVPSGRVFYSPHEEDAPETEFDFARRHFFMSLRFRNPFGATTTVKYDRYDLLSQEMRDAVGNLISVGDRDENDQLVTSGNDYRVLQPRLVMDANRNRAAVAFDALGMVVGTAVMGKPEEHLGDSLDGFIADPDDSLISNHLSNPLEDPYALLQNATTRLVYDLFAYWRSRNDEQPQPPLVASITRETHSVDLAEEQRTKVQYSFSYSDGFGREIQKKVLAEPGALEEGGVEINPRWVGSGCTIFNNKGKPIRQYEPFFSATHSFEFAAIVGVSAVLFYDPVERVIATLHPNGSWDKVVFDPWFQETWDVNDTVLCDPRDDGDVGGYVKPYLDSLSGWRTWYAQRADGTLGIQEQRAAEKTATHAGTPGRIWFDSLGRKVLTVSHNRLNRKGIVTDEYSASRTVLDIEGNQREIIDALGRSVMRYDHDMLGNALHQASMESGTRWILNDVGNSSIYIWNSRGFRLHTEYDPLRRSIRQWIKRDDGQELLAERTVYGEAYPDAAALNLRGKSYFQFDGTGVVRHNHYDFKGNLLQSTRRLSREYRQKIFWNDLEPQLSAAQLELNALEVKLSSLLENDEFIGETVYDARNHPIKVTSPDASIVYLNYNEANLLERLEAKLDGAETATPFITNIDYDARGRRQFIAYGNGTITSHKYDPLTLRLTQLRTLRGEVALQDFQYTYDPSGNIVSIDDRAQPLVYFDNAVVSANASYVYDALYQLIEATGREHIGLADHPQSPWDDVPRARLPHLNDGQALRRYSEQYQYDLVGNLLEMVHGSVNGNWRREYDYAEPSLLEPNQVNNRLSSTTIGNITRRYQYDEHGNTTVMPHLLHLDWDAEDQLQSVDLGGGGHAYYLYDTAGRRVRKVIERQNGTRQKERIYVGGFETYREYDGDGEVLKLERQTLHIIDDKERIALVETKTFDSETPVGTPTPLIRYQLANHLGSSSLELDETAAIISYEEYYPFGGTSYQACCSITEVSQKRYRYTGKERDEETGFYYYGARYYAPWLGRWISCDPAGLVDGSNVYRYVKNSPTNTTDPTGMWEMPSWRTVAVVAAVVVVGTVATVATAGAAGPLVVGAVASVGLTGTAATVATGVAVGAVAGAVGGAAAGAAGEATRQTVNSRALGLGNEEFSGGRIASAAGEGAVTGAAIGGAVGGAAAFATTAAGTAAIGAVGRVAQRVTPAVVRSGASAVARGVGTGASTLARTPGIKQVVQGVGTVARGSGRAVQGLEQVSEEFGIRAARSVFQGAQSAARGSVGLAQATERGAAVVERFAQTRSFAASLETMTVYRGTGLTAEINAQSESGYLLSDAARTAYVESRYAGNSVSASLRTGRAASETAHASQLKTWGSLDDYVQAHGEFGTEINVFGQRSLISTTTDPARAAYFARQGGSGSVFQANVLKAQAIPQTVTGATESEFLVPHMLKAKIMP